MTLFTYRSRTTPALVATLVALPLGTFGCGDADEAKSTVRNPLDTTPSPANPGAGLDAQRPDPCRGVALPSDQHFVAPGLCASAVAFDQQGLRQITFAANGDLIGVRTEGDVLRFRDEDGNGSFAGSREIAVLGTTGGNGNNAHLDEASGFLYAGSPDGVVRWRYSAGTSTLGAPEPVVVNQPSNGTHRYHTVHVYDGWLYVHSGSENNLVAPASPEYDSERSVLKRFRLSAFAPATPFDWAAGELVASGLRNMVGYARAPQGALYGVVNGIDGLEYDGEDVHLDNPGEALVRLEPASAHGYPFCFTAQNIRTTSGVVQPGTQLASAGPEFSNPHDDSWCQQNSEPPVSFLPAHSAPLDISFYTPGDDSKVRSLPEAWQGGAFVTQHGSFNTMPSVGHNVVFFPFDSGDPAMPRTTETPPVYPFSVVFGGGSSAGHVDGAWGWRAGDKGEERVRPVGVAVSPSDGALYVSSDSGGVLYRIGVPR
jgi:glucose/arabinose dehydrogenase